MFIRLVLIALLIFLCTTDVFGKEQHRDKRPNILIAITDDHSFKHISAQGSPFINTPNVDRIAKEGFYSAQHGLINKSVL